jgi:hypothetical protein
MNTDSFLNSSKFIVLVVLLAALSRLLPHPYNFTPIAAMALFGGTYLNNRSSALLLTITGMLLSDLLLQSAYWLGWRDYPGFHALMPVIYLSLALVTTIGSRLSGRVSAWTVPLASVAGSVVFFIVSNFGVFCFEKAHTITELGRTYVDAIPFFGNTLAGDLLYSTLLFGLYEWAKKRTQVPALQKA